MNDYEAIKKGVTKQHEISKKGNIKTKQNGIHKRNNTIRGEELSTDR